MVATRWTDPKISLILSELGLALAVAIGVWAVQGVKVKELTYIWGFSIGIFLGWFYPTENVFFSLCLPVDQETELSGFYQFCSEVFGWFPPMVFSIMVQNNITLAWALTTVAAIFFISIFFLLLCSPWEEIVEQAQTVIVDFSPDSEELEIRQDAENKNDENVEPEKVATC
jgi:MFS-type transporter involved in bile tolerance (Atg22 family)